MPPVSSSTTFTISLFFAIRSKNGSVSAMLTHGEINFEQRRTAVADWLIAFWTSSRDGCRMTCGWASSTWTSKNGLSTCMKSVLLPRVPTRRLMRFSDRVVVPSIALNISRLKCDFSDATSAGVSSRGGVPERMVWITLSAACSISLFLMSIRCDCCLMCFSCSVTNCSSENVCDSGRCTSREDEMYLRLAWIRLSTTLFTCEVMTFSR
eukprot:gene19141-biopygen19407